MEWLPKGQILVPAKDRRPVFFRKMHQFKAAILLYQSSLERKNFMKLEKTQLFYLFNKLTTPFDVPKACKDEKTKRGICIIFFHADKHTNIIENFRSGTSVYK